MTLNLDRSAYHTGGKLYRL